MVSSNQNIHNIATAAQKLYQNVEKVIVGKQNVVELVLVSVLCGGHVLIEDVPGIGKTMLARSVARSLDCTFRRIQCTPDLLPSDITGSYIFNQQNNSFEFRQGPIFAQVILGDEINRATPRTQSALLEAMEEGQVTAEGDTMPLPKPFLVLATQNPVELEGTFPLPEAQLDRFLLRVQMGYPTEEEDQLILERFARHNPVREIEPVVSADQLLELQQSCGEVLVDDDVRQYIIKLIHSAREHPQVELGPSPRAMLGLFRTAQALAAVRGESFVIPDHVKYLAPYVLTHRIIPSPQSYLRGLTAADIVEEVMNSTSVPVETLDDDGDSSSSEAPQC